MARISLCLGHAPAPPGLGSGSIPQNSKPKLKLLRDGRVGVKAAVSGCAHVAPIPTVAGSGTGRALTLSPGRLLVYSQAYGAAAQRARLALQGGANQQVREEEERTVLLPTHCLLHGNKGGELTLSLPKPR